MQLKMLWMILLHLVVAKYATAQGTSNLTLVLSELPQLSNFTSYLSLFPDFLSKLESGNYTSNCPQSTHSTYAC